MMRNPHPSFTTERLYRGFEGRYRTILNYSFSGNPEKNINPKLFN